ncbi:MAG: uridine kinase [Candidatus Dadabacteria bacterium]|nr:MAG: uridine kinase [Candidatus Dadabacteria bacterium]
MKSMYLIGIAGGSGSGKTTLAEMLVKLGGSNKVSCIQTDWYYRAQDHLPLKERDKVNYDHPDAVEASLLCTDLCRLMEGQSVECPQYDFTVHTRSGVTKTIKPSPVVIVEGILALYYEKLLPLYDLKVFVSAPDELRFKRRLARDVTERGRTPESVKKQWQETVLPMHQEFCEPSRTVADFIIPDGFVNEPIAKEILDKALAANTP